MKAEEDDGLPRGMAGKVPHHEPAFIPTGGVAGILLLKRRVCPCPRQECGGVVLRS